MLRNYFKIAWRNLQRNKAYAIINVLGLSLGIGCCIVIFTLISYHLSFDTFHNNSDRIYRIVTEWQSEEKEYSGAVPQPLGKAFRTEYTFAEKTARVVDYRNPLVTIPGGEEVKKFEEEEGIVYAEPEILDIFNFPLIQGNSKTALSTPNSAVITQKLAKKYFGSQQAMGKTIKINNRTNFIITGIMQDLPPNTGRRQEIWLSYQNLKDQNAFLASDSSWSAVYSGSQCYTLLKTSATKAQVNKALLQIVKKNYSGRDANEWAFKLQPLADVHFNPDYDGYADKKYLWALFFIGLFLVVTACVNFINLATAQALNRSKEVGIRKVLGASTHNILWLFGKEFSRLLLIAFAIAAPFAWWVMHLYLQDFKYRIQIGAGIFLPAIGATFLIAGITVGYRSLRSAVANPAKSLRTE